MSKLVVWKRGQKQEYRRVYANEGRKEEKGVNVKVEGEVEEEERGGGW